MSARLVNTYIFASSLYRKQCDMCNSWQDPKYPILGLKDTLDKIIWVCGQCEREYNEITLYHRKLYLSEIEI
jgi:hypothetical protein